MMGRWLAVVLHRQSGRSAPQARRTCRSSRTVSQSRAVTWRCIGSRRRTRRSYRLCAARGVATCRPCRAEVGVGRVDLRTAHELSDARQPVGGAASPCRLRSRVHATWRLPCRHTQRQPCHRRTSKPHAATARVSRATRTRPAKPTYAMPPGRHAPPIGWGKRRAASTRMPNSPPPAFGDARQCWPC